MQCYRCHADIGTNLGLCEKCRHDIVQHPSPESMSHRTKSSSSMIPVILENVKWFALIIVCGFVFLWVRRPIDVPRVALSSNAYAEPRDVCQAGRRCVVCYLAPWCPACQSGISVVQELQVNFRNKSDIEFQVVVGSASMQDIAKMASNIGGRIFFDPNSEFARAAQIRSFPSLFLLDENHRLSARANLVHGGTPENRLQYISKALGL